MSTLTDAFAATAEQVTTMTPPQIDALNAACAEEQRRITDASSRAGDRLQRGLGEKKTAGTRAAAPRWPLSYNEARAKAEDYLANPPAEVPDKLARYNRMLTVTTFLERLRKALADIDVTIAQTYALSEGPRAVLQKEFERRGGWNRFFLVPGGHLHSHWSCRTLLPTTLFSWLPELSGLTEDDAVAAHGPLLCTVCFPSAPVEWKRNPSELAREAKAATECKGSREHVELDARMARRTSKCATCPVCGKTDVSVTSTWKLRAHKPKTS